MFKLNMSAKIYILWLLAVSSARGTYGVENVKTRVVGGHDAPEGAAKYLVSLRIIKINFHFCGGSIIGDRWILTASHCLGNLTAEDIIAIAGTNSRSKGCAEYIPEKLIKHEKYKLKPLANDIGLIKTTKPIQFTDKIQPLQLPKKPTVADTTATICGWGYVDQNGSQNKELLQCLDVNVISLRKCEERYYGNHDYINFPITDNNLCTFNKKGEGICQGDSGSGLRQNNTIVGVVSWNIPCAIGFPDVFFEVVRYVDWISKTMTANKS